MSSKFLTIVLLLTLSLAGGYLARKLRLAGDRLAGVFMTAVGVFGYPLISLLSIWTTPLRGPDLWLPALAILQILILAAVGLALGRRLSKDRGEQGLLSISSALGNHGLTMGGLVIFLLYKEEGLGLANIFFMLFSPITVLLAYPIARHFATARPPKSLARLVVRGLFDWRSIGLPIALLGILLSPSVLNVPRPQFVDRFRIVDILMYAINIAAYVGIGLQLRISHVPALKKLIAGLAGTRFLVGMLTGLGMIVLTLVTPWPLRTDTCARDVVFVESFVSSAVMAVAVASMFDLRPQEASVLFVTNTMLYLAFILPLVLWLQPCWSAWLRAW